MHVSSWGPTEGSTVNALSHVGAWIHAADFACNLATLAAFYQPCLQQNRGTAGAQHARGAAAAGPTPAKHTVRLSLRGGRASVRVCGVRVCGVRVCGVRVCGVRMYACPALRRNSLSRPPPPRPDFLTHPYPLTCSINPSSLNHPFLPPGRISLWRNCAHCTACACKQWPTPTQ